MADYYADSSALVKRHVQEAGSTHMRALSDPAQGHTIITIQLSQVEVISALQRRVREGVLLPADAAQLQADFTALCQAEYRLIGVLDSIITSACQLLTQHPLRAYDALQLAAALHAHAALIAADLAPLTFLSADTRLLQAAAAEGLTTEDPGAHP